MKSKRGKLYREPYGVFGIISPWNYPFSIPATEALAALAAGNAAPARQLARVAIRELRDLDRDFRAYWPLRNKRTTQKCSAFLRWRIDDYLHERLHFAPSEACGGVADS